MNTVTSAFQIKSLCLNSWQARSSPAPVNFKKKYIEKVVCGSLFSQFIDCNVNFCLYRFMKFSREAGVLWMEWIFLFTLSSKEELAALSSFMLLQDDKGQLLKLKMHKHTQITDLIIRLVSTNITLWTYWMKPAWRSCLAFCSLCFSCSSCLL